MGRRYNVHSHQYGVGYLAAVLDLKNKDVIGYEVSKNIDSELCKRALANALALRGRHKGLVFLVTEGVSTVAEHTKVCWLKTALRTP